MISEDDYITTDKYLSFANDSVVYIKTDVLVHTRPIMWRGHIHTGIPAETWITGHSDYGITVEVYNKFSQYCKRWYTVNRETSAPNLYALPLGITNDCDDSPIHRIYGNTRMMWEISQIPRNIQNRVYMNFSVHTFPHERLGVHTMFKDKSWVSIGIQENTFEGRKRFLLDIRNHEFVLCPRGNGVDTHRLWETLYMGSIPILRRHIALSDFEDLPICWINSWDEITPEFLDKEKQRIESTTWNLDKLTISYWKKRITDKV
jgi:hypothetical protein